MRFFKTVLLVSIALSSCKQAVDLKPSDLKGKWNFSKAFRNGKQAKTLESAFFEFQDDKSVSSNLFIEKQTTTFTVENSKLVINDELPLEFEVVAFSKDSLQLKGQMNSFEMEFHLVKAEN